MQTCESTASPPRSCSCATANSRRRSSAARSGSRCRVIVDGTWGFASNAELDPISRRRNGPARGPGRHHPVAAQRRAHRARAGTGLLTTSPGCRTTSSTRSTCRPPTRSPCSTNTPAGCWPPTGSTTFPRVCTPSRNRRSTPTRSARRSPSSGCAFSRRSRRWPSTPRQARSRPCARWHLRRRRGWEFVAGDDVWDWSTELAELPSLLAEKTKAPSVVAGATDLVIDPSNLWLTIHESIGHATEYDRAIGYEAAYAGTSFATPDKLGSHALRVVGHERDRRPDRRVRLGDHRIRRRGSARPEVGPGA